MDGCSLPKYIHMWFWEQTNIKLVLQCNNVPFHIKLKCEILVRKMNRSLESELRPIYIISVIFWKLNCSSPAASSTSSTIARFSLSAELHMDTSICFPMLPIKVYPNLNVINNLRKRLRILEHDCSLP